MREVNEKLLLQQFLNAMTHASGAAWQMIHMHSDPRFISIRDGLEAIKTSAISIAIQPGSF